MTDQSVETRITITDEMVNRGLDFFVRFSIDSRATETTYPDFVVDLLNFTLYGEEPPVVGEKPPEGSKVA